MTDSVSAALLREYGRLCRLQRDLNPPLFEIADISEDDESGNQLSLYFWHVTLLYHNEDARRLRGSRVLLSVRFKERGNETLNVAPDVRIIRPRVIGENIFQGVICASEFGSGNWHVSKLGDILMSIRMHIAQVGTVERDGTYTEQEQQDAAVHIAASHPNWKLPTDLDPTLINESRALVDEGRKLYSEGKLQEALDVMNKSIDMLPAAMSFNERGHVHFAMKQYELAHADYQAARARGDHNIYRYNLAKASYYANNIDRALKESEDVQNDPKVTSWLFHTLAEVLRDRARKLGSAPKEALPLLQRSCELNPNTGATYYEIGVVQISLSAYDDAIAAFTQAIEISQPDRSKDGVSLLRLALIERGKAFRATVKPVHGLFDAQSALHLRVSLDARELEWTCLELLHMPQCIGQNGPMLPYWGHVDDSWRSVVRGTPDSRERSASQLETLMAPVVEQSFRRLRQSDALVSASQQMRGVGLLSESVRLIQEAVLAYPSFKALNIRGFLRFESNDFKGAIADYTLLTTRYECGYPPLENMSLANLANSYYNDGNLSEAWKIVSRFPREGLQGLHGALREVLQRAIAERKFDPERRL